MSKLEILQGTDTCQEFSEDPLTLYFNKGQEGEKSYRMPVSRLLNILSENAIKETKASIEYLEKQWEAKKCTEEEYNMVKENLIELLKRQ